MRPLNTQPNNNISHKKLSLFRLCLRLLAPSTRNPPVLISGGSRPTPVYWQCQMALIIFFPRLKLLIIISQYLLIYCVLIVSAFITKYCHSFNLHPPKKMSPYNVLLVLLAYLLPIPLDVSFLSPYLFMFPYY